MRSKLTPWFTAAACHARYQRVASATSGGASGAGISSENVWIVRPGQCQGDIRRAVGRDREQLPARGLDAAAVHERRRTFQSGLDRGLLHGLGGGAGFGDRCGVRAAGRGLLGRDILGSRRLGGTLGHRGHLLRPVRKRDENRNDHRCCHDGNAGETNPEPPARIGFGSREVRQTRTRRASPAGDAGPP